MYATGYQSLCVTAGATVTCDKYDSLANNANYYYYPVMKRIVINSAITAATAFNFYLLV